MSTNDDDRDTHFQFSARLLWDELEAAIRAYGYIPESKEKRAEFLPMIHTLIARCLYDLVETEKAD